MVYLPLGDLVKFVELSDTTRILNEKYFVGEDGYGSTIEINNVPNSALFHMVLPGLNLRSFP